MDRREVTVCIRSLNLNTPDNLIFDYLNKFGQVMSSKVVYYEDREGPLKGLRNGDRNYLVDFTNDRNMGTFHIIDEANVLVNYTGQSKTCSTCHNTAVNCLGGGWARACEEKQGFRTTMLDHMKAPWNEIGFVTSNFKLDVDNNDVENLTEDIEIKDSSHFTPTHKKQAITPEKVSKVSGISIKNLPKDTFKDYDTLKLLECL